MPSLASELDPEKFEDLDLVLLTILSRGESKQILPDCQYLRTLARALNPQFD